MYKYVKYTHVTACKMVRYSITKWNQKVNKKYPNLCCNHGSGLGYIEIKIIPFWDGFPVRWSSVSGKQWDVKRKIFYICTSTWQL